MPKLHLTKAVIDELAPGPSETVYWDDSLPGFGLKVTPKGRKVWPFPEACRLRKWLVLHA